jgi:apolipoprotein N-acyltransferase
VDLLFVPANDWLEVKDIHAGMAAFRAVENGMSLFRQTGEGVSMIVDAYGKVIHRVDMFEENTTGFTGIQNVQTPSGAVNTLYPSVGDGVGNLMLGGSALLLLALIVTRKKKANA